MGQRLNLAILNNEERLANAYYHWCGYTGSAAELALVVLNSIDNMPNIDPLRQAIWLLTQTRASFTEDEIERMKNEGKYDELHDVVSADSEADRNKGLISVSESGMDETEQWEEARVEIDIGKKVMYFDAILIDSVENISLEDIGLSIADLPVFNIDWTLEYNFDEAKDFLYYIHNLVRDGKYYGVNYEKDIMFSLIG